MDFCYGPSRDLVIDGAIVLHGMVGGEFYEEGFTSTDVLHALSSFGLSADVTVRINSSGGIAYEGLAIHAILSAHRGRVTTVVEGMAASAASIIAMAGDVRVIASGSMMMIHDAGVETRGDTAEHKKSITYLEATCASMAAIYADATKRSVQEIRAEMAAETWLTADEAVASGYADRIGAANDSEPAPFPFRVYAKAPQRLVAMADARGWSRRPLPPTAAASAAVSEAGTKESPMPPTHTPAGTTPAPESNQASNVVQIDEARAAGRAEALATAMPWSQGSEIAKLCFDGGVPEMTASLLQAGSTLEEARARITAAAEIKSSVATARRLNPQIPENYASAMLAEGKSLEQVRADLFHKMATHDEETVVTSHQHPQRQAVAGPEAAKSNMRAQLERSGLLKKGA